MMSFDYPCYFPYFICFIFHWFMLWWWRYVLHNHYRSRRLCRVPEALGKALKTLGKLFAECRTRQRGLGIQCIGKVVFAEYFFSGTRQRKAVVTATGDGDGVFPECPGRHWAKEFTLPSVCLTALGKESAGGVPLSGTLPSAWYGTRQSVVLCECQSHYTR
jgi:hypothetical protein